MFGNIYIFGWNDKNIFDVNLLFTFVEIFIFFERANHVNYTHYSVWNSIAC